MYAQLSLGPDGGERLAYNAPDFPVRTAKGDLSSFYQYSAACHWHRDFEFLLANSGGLDYFVNGRIVHVGQGQCIFVNANRLHYGFSSARTECLYSVLVFHPSVLGEPPLPPARYAARLSADAQRDYLLLDPGDAIGGAAIEIVRGICRTCDRAQPLYELDVQGACGRLLALLWQSLKPEARTEPTVPIWSTLRAMTGYLQEHYAQPVRLADIAAAGAVCRSKCCRLFREYLNATPIEYLNRYRLEKACGLLRDTQLSITETAHSCGFDSASYFAEMFHRSYGISPSAFRNCRRPV